MMRVLHLFHTLPTQAWQFNFKIKLSVQSFLFVGFLFNGFLFNGFLFNGIAVAAVAESSLYVSGTTVPAPVKIVESQTNLLLSELSQRKDEFDAKPHKLIHFAQNVALSHWDLRRASSFMLGKYWYKASSQHQNQFKEAFLRTLMRYVVKAYGYYDESLVKVLSYDWQPRKKGGWVKSIIRFPAGLKVAVDYRMMLNQLKQWKLVDIRVEGISLIGAKRKEYRGLIQEEGMAELLKSMTEKNAKVLDN